MADCIFQALLILLGNEREEFIFALVDPVEWSEPRYFHQN
ncbi:hypothetical protein ES703_66529 [subsurface metagenome]